MRKALALVLLVASAPAFAGDATMFFSTRDAQMNAAIAEARRTLPQFIEALRAGRGDSFAIKAAFDTIEGSREHMWLTDLTFRGGRFVGTLMNDPYDVPGLRAGDRVAVEEARGTDWMIFDNQERLGAFTKQVLERNRERSR